MKHLKDITEEEVKEICNLVNEPFLDFMVNNDGKWDSLGLEVSITTTSTMNKNSHDSNINIFKNGTITLSRNNGDWNGFKYHPINSYVIINFLKNNGYFFDDKKNNFWEDDNFLSLIYGVANHNSLQDFKEYFKIEIKNYI